MTNSLINQINHHHEKELFWCFKAYVSVYLRAAVNYKAQRDDRASSNAYSEAVFIISSANVECLAGYGNKRYSKLLIVLYNTPRLEVLSVIDESLLY